MVNMGITFIYDLINEEGEFYRYDHFINTFKINATFFSNFMGFLRQSGQHGTQSFEGTLIID